MLIKFKGKNEQSKEILFGLLLSFDGRFYIFDKYFVGYFASHRVTPESVAQFTGLYDKNGNEIYHNDKFKALSGDIYKVDFFKGAFGYYPEPEMNIRKFVSFAENFANLKGKGNQLNAIEIVN